MSDVDADTGDADRDEAVGEADRSETDSTGPIDVDFGDDGLVPAIAQDADS